MLFSPNAILALALCCLTAQVDTNFSSSFELLIIGPEEARLVAEDYAEYKNRIGVHAQFVSVAEIEARFFGADLPERIRKSIKYYRDEYRIRYVMILGDFNLVPSRIAYISYNSNPLSNNVPTDFYYAELDSDWDKNKNGLYGEMADSIDLVPQVMIGRIPYHTVSELANYFEKLKNYKRLVSPIPSVLSHCADVTGNGNSHVLGEHVLSVFPNAFEKRRLYEIGSSVNLSKEQFIDSVNSSPSYVYSCSHGDFSNLYINQTPQVSFGFTDLHLLTAYPAFWGILSCDVGGYDRNALGEHLLFNASSIGILTQTRDGFTSSNPFFVEFFEKLFSSESYSLGEADSAMRSHFAVQGGSSIVSYYSLLSYVLLADPTMVPQKQSYHRYQFSELRISEDTLLVVKVRPSPMPTSKPVYKKFVLYKKGEILSATSTEQDSVIFSMHPRSPGYVYVTVTGAQALDITDSIYITPFTVPVTYGLEYSLNEFGDSVIVSNAHFELGVKVKNTSSKILSPLNILIRADSIITLVDSVFRVKLGPFEETGIRVRGKVKVAQRDCAARVILLTETETSQGACSIILDVSLSRLEISHLRVLRNAQHLVFNIKISNPNRYTVKDVKVFAKGEQNYMLSHIRQIRSQSDTTVIDSIPIDPLLSEIRVFYMNDSIVIPISPHGAILPAPYGLSGSSAPGSVNLKWRSPYPGLLFNVYRSYDGVDYGKINDDFVHGVNFTDYTANGPAYYCVTALDTICNLESNYSNAILMAPNPLYMEGWPKSTPGTGYSTPVVCQFDASTAGLELIIAASFDSVIYAFSLAGELLPGWPVHIPGTVLSALASGDIDGDGEEEVVVPTWSGIYGLHVFNKDGSDLPGFPVVLSGSCGSTPAIMDLNGDTIPEIIIKDGSYIKVFGNNGVLLRSRYLGWNPTSPACGDLNGDSLPEIVVSYSNTGIGYVTALDFSLNPIQGFPYPISPNDITSPSIGELYEGAAGPEIVVCAGDSLYVVSSSGSLISCTYTGALTSWSFAISPAIADVDGDGIKDICIPYANGIKVFRSNGSLLSGFPLECGGGFSSCVVGDVDGDGRCEVLKGSVDNMLYACDSDGSIILGFPVDLFSYAYITPQVVDLNLDGNFEIVASSWANSVFVYETRGLGSGDSWPMYKHDRQRSGWAEFECSINTVVKDPSISEHLEGGIETNMVTVYDIMGREVYGGDYSSFEKTVVRHLKSGIYFIKASGKSEVTKRMVIK